MGAVVGTAAELSTMDHVVVAAVVDVVAVVWVDYSEIGWIQYPATFLTILLP